MAAPILSYEGLGLHQGEGWLFRGLDVHIGGRDRLALIGRNGVGKTTLLKCLADLIETDEGRRVIVPGTIDRRPSSVSIIPAKHLSKVVLPAPLRPISASRSRGPTCRSRSRNSQPDPWISPRFS